MKYILVLLFSLNFLCAQQIKTEKKEVVKHKTENKAISKINWMTMNEALAAQKKAPKKIFIDFYTKWCGPCKLLDKITFQNTDVANYINDNFYAVKFNSEGNENVDYENKEFVNKGYIETNRRGNPHPFSIFMKIRSYPTMLFLDEESNYILPISGVFKPKELELFLKVIGTDEYKKIITPESWEKYKTEFKPEFK